MDKSILIEMRKAIKNNDLEKVKFLTENNNGILEEETPFGTWLEVAATKGNIDMVKYFIECGLDVNKCCGITNGGPLASAAFYGHLDIVKLLLENGATIDVSTAEKNPLFSAIYNGHLNVVEYLVEYGIDLKVAYDMGTLKNVDAYEYARQYGRTEIAEYLKNCSL